MGVVFTVLYWVINMPHGKPRTLHMQNSEDFGRALHDIFNSRAEEATELAVASLPLKANTCTFRSCVNPSQPAAASYRLKATSCMSKEFSQD